MSAESGKNRKLPGHSWVLDGMTSFGEDSGGGSAFHYKCKKCGTTTESGTPLTQDQLKECG